MVQHPAPLYPHRANLRDALLFGGKPGGFQVEADKLPVQGSGAVPHRRGHQVVDKIGLCAVNDLEVRVLLADVRLGVHGLGEGLGHPVVRDGHGLLAPSVGLVDQVRGGGDAIQVGHAGVQVQLHPLFHGVVHHLHLVHSGNGPGPQHVFPVVPVIFQGAPHQNGLALFQLVQLLALGGVLNHL